MVGLLGWPGLRGPSEGEGAVRWTLFEAARTKFTSKRKMLMCWMVWLDRKKRKKAVCFCRFFFRPPPSKPAWSANV